MSERVFNVLFLCTGNSARSIMAEAILNHVGKGRFIGYSAGSHPTGRINAYALEQLHRARLDTSNLRSKSWDEFTAADAPKLDFVFTVCDNAAAEVCPVWPGQPMTAHWGVADPAAEDGSEAQRQRAAFDAFTLLNRRVSLFVNLPVARLDALSLQREIDDIGRLKAPDA